MGEVRAKVKAVKSNHVSYTPFDQQSIKPIKVSKRKIEVIIFEDGMKQYFAVEDYQPDTLIYSSAESNLQSTDSRGFYFQGVEDAKVNYKKDGLYGVLCFQQQFLDGELCWVQSLEEFIAAVPANIDPYELPNSELYFTKCRICQGYEKQVSRRKLGEGTYRLRELVLRFKQL